MAEDSAIEWTDHTHNHWEGCTKVSVGPCGACELCYAEARDIRFTGGKHWGPGAPRRLTSEANRRKPYAWDLAAAKAGRREWVFCSSLADVFDNEVAPSWRNELWAMIARTGNLNWQLLTKRIGNAAKMLPDPAGVRIGWQHVGVMATIATQAEAERDIPKLVALKASHGVRWVGLSCEPLLGELDLSEWLAVHLIELQGRPHWTERTGQVASLDWVVSGGETDPARQGRARPSHPDWHRSLRDQCAAAGVPYLFKQWGDFLYFKHDSPCIRQDCTARVDGREYSAEQVLAIPGALWGVRVGKARAGRELDGRIHHEMPRVFD